MDLVTTSVLLDAGAGDVWKYTEKATGFEAGRSEGLGVASFHMFGSGAFSSDPGSAPHRADSVGLKGLADDSVRTAFQVDDDANPLVGCEGRTQVLYTTPASHGHHHQPAFGSTAADIRYGLTLIVHIDLAETSAVSKKRYLALFALVWRSYTFGVERPHSSALADTQH